MRILFSVSHYGFLRNFEFALRELASRGHTIHVVADRRETLGGEITVEALTTAHAGITAGFAPNPKKRAWYAISLLLRRSLDYLRYLEPIYDGAPKLRQRAEDQVPRTMVRLARGSLGRTRAGRRLLAGTLRMAERSIPVDATVDAYVRKQHPDVLLVTPLLYFGSQQVEYVRAARANGITSVLCVGSWDHLTTKGVIHDVPDWVTVWNAAQQREARQLHGIPESRVVVTGAQAYDHWFRAKPSTSAAEFRAQLGLSQHGPLLLYLCSSPFIAPYEVGFVTRWIEALRDSDDPRLRTTALLIRPHPQNAEQWQQFDHERFENVVVWPRAGANPVNADARAVYFDSMYHASAVVGVNTSGQIESAILGRPVMTVLSDEFRTTQDGTLHFQHLTSEAGGLLHVARDLGEHVQQLSEVLRTDGDLDPKSRAFVEAFVRPHGLERDSAVVFADAIERCAAYTAVPVTPPAWTVPVSRILRPLARIATRAQERRRPTAAIKTAQTNADV